MRIKVWGARGSIPAPGPETMRYGGNTSCVEMTLCDGSTLILDAGTGIRNLGLALSGRDAGGRDRGGRDRDGRDRGGLARDGRDRDGRDRDRRDLNPQPIHILLTHLHLDHIQGLMFFAPAFRPESEIIIWGPASPEASLRDRIARYISAPLAPVEVRELPSLVSFREAEPLEWDIGPARIQAQAVNHRGPTLGYRITADDCSLCYIPDHEPGLGAPLAELDDDWISGFELARGASMLIHDCQYTDREYPNHLGWGHSPMSDALEFGHRVGAERLLMFHHDPLHSDGDLDAMSANVAARWTELGHAAAAVELATERRELAIEPAPAPARVR